MSAFEEFQTDEFFRYAAECRRMARLARQDTVKIAQANDHAFWQRGMDWIAQSFVMTAATPARSTVR